jgi:hypothetical protein
LGIPSTQDAFEDQRRLTGYWAVNEIMAENEELTAHKNAVTIPLNEKQCYI